MTSPRIDRLPPHSTDNEQGVIGCLLLGGADTMAECLDKNPLGAQVFYDLRHGIIYSAVQKLYDDRKGIDSISVSQTLQEGGNLASIGGLEYLSSLPDTVPSAANLDYYLDVVLKTHVLRKLIQACGNIVAKAYEPDADPEALLDAVEGDLLALRDGAKSETCVPIRDLIGPTIDQIEKYHQNQGKLIGIPTGLIDLDKKTGGLRDGDMIIIAARTSVGKTSLVMQMAEHAARAGFPVGVFSLEMTKESLAMRSLCSSARVNLHHIQQGFMAERDFPKLTGTAGRFKKLPLYIDDSSGLSINRLRAKARRMHHQHGIKMFVIDYVQLLTAMNSNGRRMDNRVEELEVISAGIKNLAKELQVPVVGIAQLNREVERNKGRAPQLSDIKGCGSIEQDADLIGLLFPVESDDEPENPDLVPTRLLIGKQRNGPTGPVDLLFNKGFTVFEGMSRIQDADIP